MKRVRSAALMLIAVLVLGGAGSMDAKYIRVRDERRLDAVVSAYDMVVVLFYNKRMAHASIKNAFKQLSRGYSYCEADVAFVAIDIARENGADIAADYGIKKTPALILFEDERLVIGRDNTPVIATRVCSASDIRLFINTYFGDRIQDTLRGRQEMDRDARRSRRSRRSGFKFGISYGYPYYPYYGYPFGYSYGYPILMGW